MNTTYRWKGNGTWKKYPSSIMLILGYMFFSNLKWSNYIRACFDVIWSLQISLMLHDNVQSWYL